MPKVKYKTIHLACEETQTVQVRRGAKPRSSYLNEAEIVEALGLIDSDNDGLPPIDIFPEENADDNRTQTEFITRELPVFIRGRVSYSAILM